MSASNPLAGVPEDGPLLPRKPIADEGRFDITAMIDLVFMMNIFFLVTSFVAVAAKDLPLAQHVVAADQEQSVVVSLITPEAGRPAQVFLGTPGPDNEPLPNNDEQDERIRAAVEEGLTAGKKNVLIMAAKTVLHRDVARVSSAAHLVEGIKVNLGVLEFE
jgi:biopolymer transport protein ExbD